MIGARHAGLTEREVVAVIWRMAVYGGLPAAIDALNTAMDVSAEIADG